mgnify:CR=1 FL=1
MSHSKNQQSFWTDFNMLLEVALEALPISRQSRFKHRIRMFCSPRVITQHSSRVGRTPTDHNAYFVQLQPPLLVPENLFVLLFLAGIDNAKTILTSTIAQALPRHSVTQGHLIHFRASALQHCYPIPLDSTATVGYHNRFTGPNETRLN